MTGGQKIDENKTYSVKPLVYLCKLKIIHQILCIFSRLHRPVCTQHHKDIQSCGVCCRAHSARPGVRVSWASSSLVLNFRWSILLGKKRSKIGLSSLFFSWHERFDQNNCKVETSKCCPHCLGISDINWDKGCNLLEYNTTGLSYKDDKWRIYHIFGFLAYILLPGRRNCTLKYTLNKHLLFF